MSESSRVLWLDCSFVLGNVPGDAGNDEWILPAEAWLPTGDASQFLISVEATVGACSAGSPTVDLKLETPLAQSPRTDAFEAIGAAAALVQGYGWYEFDVGRGGTEQAVRGGLRLHAVNTGAVDATVHLRVWVAGQTLPGRTESRLWGQRW